LQGELDQIQFLFGRNSLQTIQRYLGKHRLRSAVHENLGLKPQAETFIEVDFRGVIRLSKRDLVILPP
jgi:hypothetical protein